ncbi:endochitinase [Mycena latifolia]|nr:endochitinase [Mycena latifolia]
MYRTLSLLLCAQFLAHTSATQHIHRSPSGTSPVDVNPRAANTTSDGTEIVVASAWFPDWAGESPTQLSWDKYTHMVFAFAVTTPDPANISIDNSTLLTDFVAEARNNNVSPLLAIGGWTGSRYFSTAVTAEHRSRFVQAALGLVTQYGLDGIDFDWEYPGQQGIGCNVVASDDSANFLAFLELRQENSTLVLTAAVGTQPFVGADKEPMTDVSAFADVLDRIELMVYDAWDSSTTHTAGANAPLTDCPGHQQGSVTSAFPAEKIVLGLAAYGHSYNVTPADAEPSSGGLSTYPALGGAQPAGPSDNSSSTAPDVCDNVAGVSGVYTFAELVDTGFLSEDGTPLENHVYDQCTRTPYVYNETSHVLISYDDPMSFAAKGEFIVDRNLAGFAIWDALGDYKDVLVESLYTSMGIEDCE